MSARDQPGRLQRAPVVGQVEAALRADLTSGRWAGGDRIPSETALASELGVGRSSLREAVQLLAREGLLDVRHGSGTFVRTGPQGDGASVAQMLRRSRIVEVYEVRRALEAEAARLAAVRADAAGLDALDAVLERRQQLVGADTAQFVDADLHFHRAVVELAGNALLAELFGGFLPPLRAALIDLVDHEPSLPDTSDDHAALLHALRRGDPDAAVSATIAHFEATIAFLQGR